MNGFFYGRKIIIKTAGCMGLFLLLTCCATIKEPSAEINTLLTGKILFEASNYPPNPNINMNRSASVNIIITVLNTETRESINIASGKNGFFTLAGLPPGVYEIKYLSYRYDQGNWYNLCGFPVNFHYFTVIPEAVTNIGTILWLIVYPEQTFIINHGYDDVQNWFAGTHEKSAWNAREWIPSTITKRE